MTDWNAAESEQIPPAYSYRPPRVRSLADAVAGLAASVGRPLDPEQYTAVDILTGEHADGRPAALEGAIVVPRQNMKTFLFQMIVLARLLRPNGDRLTVWSAHLFDTAQSTFRDYLEMIDAYSHISKRVEKIVRANGEEEIQFSGNRRLRFRARGKTGGRGLSGDCIVLDEAFALQGAHMGALLPILSTRRNALVLYGSSAPLADSEVLRGIIARGRRGGPGAPAFVEYCAPGSYADPGCAVRKCTHAPGTPGCVLDREDYWIQANPAVRAGRISMQYLRAERQALPPLEFARERLGWGEEDGGISPITLARWGALADRESRPEPRPVGLALDTSKGLRSAAIAAVGRRADDRIHAEILRAGPGTDWVADYLSRKCRELGAGVRVLGGSSTAQALIPALERVGVPVEETTTTDYATACGLLADDVTEGRLAHLADPLLERAVEGAITVPVGDAGAWRWSPERSVSEIAPLVALTLARWQFETSAAVASDVF